MEQNFSFTYRNPGHWDVYNHEKRIYRIRGESGDYWVDDERIRGDLAVRRFKTITAAVAFIADDLMIEVPVPAKH